MSQDKWYHGRLSRQKAEELVFKAGLDGSFVVRASESIVGAYALSVLHGGTIHTYRILPTESGLLAVQTINGVQQRKFTSITELIRAYRNPQNGLVCGLVNPVGPASDKPALAPPPAVATPIPTRNEAMGRIPQVPAFTESARPVALPPSFPAPQPQGGGMLPPPRTGVRVIFDEKKLPPQRDRELPPVPVPMPRDVPQRSASPVLPSQTSVPTNPSTVVPPPGKSTGAEIKGKLRERVKMIINTCSSSVGMPFLDQLQQYCMDGAERDVNDVLNGSRQCVEMQKMLAKEAEHFQDELDAFLLKLDVLRQLFDVQSAVSPPTPIRSDKDLDLEMFLTRLGDCKKAVKNLDKRITITIKEQAGMEVESMYGTALRTASMKSNQSMPEYNFEVKTDGGLKQSRAKLQVNIDLGRLMIIKGDDLTQFTNNQVLQIIKNNKSQSKLSVLFEGGKKREYAFEGGTQREAFCQVMQLVRNMHSGNTEPDFVSTFIGTWNMGDAMPPIDIRSWFKCAGTGRTLDPSVCNIAHDIYVVGTQETGLPEKEWLQKVTETLMELTGEKFHLIAMDALWHIKILILVKEIHKNRISHIQTSSVKTGIANTLGNKGAVAVAFQFGGTSLCFINAHLTSGNEKCSRRNQNYHDIMRSLNLGHDRRSVFDLTNRFDHLFFLGDLNYRLEMEVQEILAHIKKRDLGMLYKVDQLRREKEMHKVFYGFGEEEIQFPPTYRYERGTREAYSHLKIKRTGIRINVPSWCDRVLWKSYPETHNVCMAYGCSDDIMTSDHSPVFCNMQIGVRGQYVSNEGIKSGNKAPPATIIFESMEAILKAPGKTNFYLQFHSSCLSSVVRTPPNSKYDTTELGQNCIRIVWDNLPQLQPIISDREYLVDQHLLVLIKGDDDHDTHAEFALALRSMIATAPQKFQEHLTRKGEDAGQIQGTMHVKTRDTTLSRKEKTYEFIQFGKREEMAVEPVVYGETTDTSRDPPRSSILANVAPGIANAVSKITNATAKITSSQKSASKPAPVAQNWTQPRDTRPPMAIPTQAPQGAAHAQSVTYTADSLQRSAPSGESTPSPQRMTQMSPVFPSRPISSRPNSDHMTFDLTTSTTGKPEDQSLDSVIAEFEAAGSMFDEMDAHSDAHSNWQQNTQQTSHYDTITRAPVSIDMHRPLPPPSGQAPTLPSYSTPHLHSSALPTKPRTVIGQAAPPPIQTRAVIGQSAGPLPSMTPRVPARGVSGQMPGPAYPPPTTPAPQLYSRKKSVRVAGSSNPIASVNELMERLGLSQYSESLLRNGWDSLEFLSDLRDQDLVDCGIVSEDHRRAIMSCIGKLEWME